MKVLVSILFFTLITGCATSGLEIKRGSRIAPISIVGDALEIRVVGFTIFQNKAGQIDVSDWKVDENIEAVATAAIEKSGLIAGKASAGARKEIGRPSFLNFTSPLFPGRAEILQKAARHADADYLLIVAKAPNASPDPFFKTNQSINGYGIYQRLVMGTRKSVNFVHFAVLLVDGKTGKEVAHRIHSFSSPRPSDLWIELDDARPDAANLSHTRGAIENLIEAVINLAWDRMKLTVVP